MTDSTGRVGGWMERCAGGNVSTAIPLLQPFATEISMVSMHVHV